MQKCALEKYDITTRITFSGPTLVAGRKEPSASIKGRKFLDQQIKEFTATELDTKSEVSEVAS